METQSLPANLFELHGHGLHITYTATSLGGQPQFHYQDGHTDQNFSGDALRVEHSEIGSLVTVTIQKSVDSDFTTFTLVVPEIHLAGKETHFSTLGIVTLHHFLASNPNLITGPLETYHARDLHGTAQFVEF